MPGVARQEYDKTPEYLFGCFNSLTLKEYCFLSDLDEMEAYGLLVALHRQNKVRHFETVAGDIWLGNFNSLDEFR